MRIYSSLTLKPVEMKDLALPATPKRDLPCPMLNSDSDNICVKTYFDLLKKKKIEIFTNSQREFFALIHLLDDLGNSVNISSPLRVTDIPKPIQALKNIDKVISFFEHTHLIPEKGVDGNYNRVSMHITGMGGVKPKIPFQPGLVLGSIVEGETLEKMERYASSMAKSEALNEQLRNAEQKIKDLSAQIAAEAKSHKESSLTKYWIKEKVRHENFIKKIHEKLLKEEIEEIPVFEGFHQGLVTPIDTAASKLAVQPRGYDSIHYVSQYISMKLDTSEIHNKVDHISNANSASLEGGWGLFKGKLAHDWSQATADRLARIKHEGKAEGVLLINAMVTTRNVQCFTDIKYDKHKLKMIYSAMQSTNPLELKRHGITISDGKKKIYLLTEAVQGGVFTGIVTFYDEKKMQRKADKHMQEDGSATSVSGSAGYSALSVSGGFSRASQSASQKEDEILQSVANTKVDIEFQALGAVTKCMRETVEQELIKHFDLNPSKFELTPKDATYAKTLVEGTPQEKAIATCERQMKMENASVAAVNSMRELTSTKEKQSLHTLNSLMETYDNFALQMINDPNCGIPIGFNYLVLDEDRIKAILEELEPSTKSKRELDEKKEEPSQKKPRAENEKNEGQAVEKPT